MAAPFVGEIRAFPFDFAPLDWAYCSGQSMPVQQNTALYSVIGNTYGGNQQSFHLPDLRGRAAMGTGTGPGRSPRLIGDAVGSASVTLNLGQLPLHDHKIVAQADNAGSAQPDNRFLAQGGTSGSRPTPQPTYAEGTLNTPLAANALALSGQSGAHSNMQPYLALNFCICLYGEYPIKP